MDRKALLAFVLIGLIILFYPYYLRLISGPKPSPGEKPSIPPVEQKIVPEEVETLPQELSIPEFPSPPSKRELAQEIIVDTDLYRAVFTTQGAGLRSWRLKNFSGPNGDWVELIPPEAIQAPGVVIFQGKERVNFSTQPFQADRLEEITLSADHPSDSLSMRLDLGNGRILTKKFTFYNHLYSFDLRVEIRGFGDRIRTREYQVRWQPGLCSTETNLKDDMNYAKAYALMGDELEEVNTNEYKEVKKDLTGDTAWMATRTKYFLASVIPLNHQGTGVEIEARRLYQRPSGVKPSQAGLSLHQIRALAYLDRFGRITLSEYMSLNQILDEHTALGEFRRLVKGGFIVPGRKEYSVGVKAPLNPNQYTQHDYLVYLGPLDYGIIREYGVGLEKVMYRGFGSAIISPISRLILRFLVFVHQFVPNYGLVIIIFSVLVKFLFHPLTRKQLEATKSMQELQPKLAALKEKYKNDPQRLNRETMALYRKHGFNPLGGCLPLLLQLPVLWALFNVFRETIELRGAEFISWWIKDLSQKDPYYILPGIMALSMFVQQKMTTKDPKQMAMVYIMPIVMFFLFKGFASGLVLYWTMFNVLSILHQLIVEKGGKQRPPLIEERKEKKRTGGRRDHRKRKDS